MRQHAAIEWPPEADMSDETIQTIYDTDESRRGERLAAELREATRARRAALDAYTEAVAAYGRREVPRPDVEAAHAAWLRAGIRRDNARSLVELHRRGALGVVRGASFGTDNYGDSA